MVKRITAYGVGSPKIDLAPAPIESNGIPNNASKNLALGQLVKDTTSGDWLAYNGTGQSFSVLSPGAGGGVSTLTGDSGTATPALGNIQIATGTNLTSTAAGSTVTITLDADVATVFSGNSGSTNPVGNVISLIGQGSVLTGAGTPAGTVNIRGDGLTSVITGSGTAIMPVFPNPTANQMTFTGAGGISTSAVGSTITFTGSGSGSGPWVNISGPGALAPATSYYFKGNSTAVTMPTDGASNFGEIIEIFVSPNSTGPLILNISTVGQRFYGLSIPAPAGKTSLTMSVGSSIRVVFFQAILESTTGWAILSATGTISFT